jgi:anti-sigma B factor antagonist
LVRPSEFRIETKDVAPGVRRVTPVGELDLATSPRLESEVERTVSSGAAQVVVDVSQVSFLDSTGLRMFLALHERAQTEGWVLTLAAPSEAVRSILEITGSSESLPLVDD